MTRAFGPPPTPAAPVEADDLPAWQRLLVGSLWIVALVVTIGVLNRLGSGQFSTPPLLDRSELQLWLDDRDAVIAAFAVIRLVALGLAWYLLIVTVLGLAARLSHIPALVRVADVATLPAVRKILGAVAGVGLTASAASLMAANLLPDQSQGGGAGRLADNQVVLERLPDSDEVILRRLPDAEDGTATLDVEEAPTDEQAPATWTAAPGDHLWHVAEATLTESWGRAPTDGEIDPYWRVVVEANRDVLADPSNPDLIHPGQTFRIPTPPPAPPMAAPPP